jgi:hypothetical protein
MKNSIQALEPDCIDGEEVHSKDALPLGKQELTPRQSTASAGWAELFLVQNLLHRCRRHHDAETFQFAHDARITPAGVLTCQPHD